MRKVVSKAQTPQAWSGNRELQHRIASGALEPAGEAMRRAGRKCCFCPGFSGIRLGKSTPPLAAVQVAGRRRAAQCRGGGKIAAWPGRLA